MLRANVEVLRLIQLGLTFLDEDGNPAEEAPTWQFNFRFNLEEDLYAPESIDLLRRSGIDFANHQEKGIEVHHFAEVLMTSGLVLCEDIKWLTFHSAYDFGYLIRLLINAPLPSACPPSCAEKSRPRKAAPPHTHTRNTRSTPPPPNPPAPPPAAEEEAFLQLLHTYFPTSYDVKHLAAICSGSGELRGGLQRLADVLRVQRVGVQHQAGSDSYVTAAVFFKLRGTKRLEGVDMSAAAGVLFGV
jgi:CCR4-NOT transcription complex subunit 7/8